MQVEKLKAEAANQQAEVQKLHATTVHQMYVDDLDAFLAAYEAWEAEEAANSGLYSDATQTHIVLVAMSLKGLSLVVLQASLPYTESCINDLCVCGMHTHATVVL